MKKFIFVFCGLAVFAAGCQKGGMVVTKSDKIDLLTEQNVVLNRELEDKKAENENIKKRLAVLTGLQDEGKLIGVSNVEFIKISSYTGLYDKDNDGVKEKLIVYLQPIDENGDVVKEAGSVEVQLWDLEKPGGNSLLNSWHVEAQELKRLWLMSFMTANYRLSFDVGEDGLNAEGPLTLKVTFTDYRGGKVFREQKTIQP